MNTAVQGMPSKVAMTAIEIRETLRAEIENGILAPGLLLDERFHAQRFNVSRTKLRQALHLLAGDDLVRMAPYIGTRVTRLSIAELRDTLEYCCEMEILTAKFAARRISNESREVIEAAQKYCRQEAKKMNGNHQKANEQFHRAISLAACSSRLSKQLTQARRMLMQYIPPAISGSIHLMKSLNEHDAIMEAIMAQDENKAMELMATHLPGGSSGFSDFLARIPQKIFAD